MNKNYKVFIITTLFASIVSAVIWGVLVYAQIGAKTESSRWIYECYQKKIKYAKFISGKKILIVSGSNSLFGISAAMIEKQLHIPTVNYAVHAGLGLKYILYQTKKVARSGDIVILPLEYPLYNQASDDIEETLIDYCFSRDIKYFLSLPIKEKFLFVVKVPVKRIKKGLRIKFHMRKEAKNYSGYQSRTLNRNGDETINITAKPDLDIKTDSTLVQGISPNSESKKNIKKFVTWCKNNNITLFATYPGLISVPAYNSLEVAKTIREIQNLYHSMDVPVIGNYKSYLFDRSLAYDGYYHLNKKGKILRTQRLIKDIRPYINTKKGEM